MDSYKLIYEEMSNHYESLLASGKRWDVVLVAGDKEIRAHKVILSARSPVFAAMFAHASTKESMESRVEIIDLDAEVLELLVRYIYTGKVDMLDQYAAGLFVAADKYQLDRLKLICKKRLLSQITTESVSDILIFADMYQATELNTEDLVLKCLDYITNNVTQVMHSDGWKKIVLSSDLMTKLYEHLHMKYSKEIYAKKKVEPKKKINCTLKPDLDFQRYLLEYSNVIDWKENKCNVVLVAGDTCLFVHKQLLSARSPVFAALMFADDTVKNSVVIPHVHVHVDVEIIDLDVQILKLLIKYIYTGNVERLGINAASKLLVAAHKYQLNCLKPICEKELLCKIITIESFPGLLIIADMCQITELYNKCLNYITNNAIQVIASVGWKTIVAKPDLLAKIFEHLNLDISEQLHLCPITIESVLNLFILADIHHFTELTTKCVEYITDNVTEVMKQEDWKKILARADLVTLLFEHLSMKYTQVLAAKYAALGKPSRSIRTMANKILVCRRF